MRAVSGLKLSRRFYARQDVTSISRDLIGKVLCTRIDGKLTSAVILETEAYAGITDKASHAYGGRRTPRTEPMFGPGGVAYVYLCYGIHHLFNVVTGVDGEPHAVLVRAGFPLDGVGTMLERRGRSAVDKSLMAGPGTISQALGIRTSMSGAELSGDLVWIEDRGLDVDPDAIRCGPRIGVDYAGEDAGLPYRFLLSPDGIPVDRWREDKKT